MQGIEDLTEACVRATSVLADATCDIVSADILLDIEGRLTPVTSSRQPTAPLLPATELADVMESGGVRVEGDTHGGSRPAERVTLSIGAAGGFRGLLVVVPSQALPFDVVYADFLELIASTVDSALQVSYRHATEIGQYRLISDTLQGAMLEPADDLPTVAARYVPASGNLSVGGDWYDVIDLGDERRALVVGDCVGHGLAAAAAMAQLRSVTRALLLEGRDPAGVLDGLDLFAQRTEDAHCATAVVMTIDRRTGLLTYSRAGHLPPLVAGPDGATWLDGGGSRPLAVMSPVEHTNATHQMGDDDILVLYSDGLIERRREPLDDGMARLHAAAWASNDQPVQAIADNILRALVPDRPRDDVVFIVKRLHSEVPPAE
jgi:hypothetical protein